MLLISTALFLAGRLLVALMGRFRGGVGGLGGGLAVVCISGFLAARGAINAPPVDVLRESQ